MKKAVKRYEHGIHAGRRIILGKMFLVFHDLPLCYFPISDILTEKACITNIFFDSSLSFFLLCQK